MNSKIREQVLGMIAGMRGEKRAEVLDVGPAMLAKQAMPQWIGRAASPFRRYGQLLMGGDPAVRQWMKAQLNPVVDYTMKQFMSVPGLGKTPWLSRKLMRYGLRKSLLRTAMEASPEFGAELRKVLAARLVTGAAGVGGAGYGVYSALKAAEAGGCVGPALSGLVAERE